MTDTAANYGFVYAASGQGYTDLALIAAHSLRRINPTAQIDFYTDCPIPDDHPFDVVFALERSMFRPKFEALIRSRFNRTVYLDADTYVVVDISDIFDVLEHHEFAAAPVIRNNYVDNRRIWKKRLPLAVPRYNCGVIGIQNSTRMRAFLQKAQDTLIAENLDHDQSMMREMLFESDIRVVTLPYEFNFNEMTMIDVLSDRFAAPRVLHFWRMRDHIRDPMSDQVPAARHHGSGIVEPMPSISELRAKDSEALLIEMAKEVGASCNAGKDG